MKRSATQPKTTQTKTAFVLSLPASLTAKEIVATGKKLGINLSEAYVYVIRRNAKGARTLRADVAASLGRPEVRAEEILRATAAVLGLASAISILRAERARVQRAIALRS